jgi:hypothetical protein
MGSAIHTDSEKSSLEDIALLEGTNKIYWTELLHNHAFTESALTVMLPAVDLYDVLKTQKNLSLNFIVDHLLGSANKTNHNETDLTIDDIIRYQPQHTQQSIIIELNNKIKK